MAKLKEKEKDPSDMAAVAALAEQERIRKRNEDKKKSNLELFKEELKRLIIYNSQKHPLKYEHVSKIWRMYSRRIQIEREERSKRRAREEATGGERKERLSESQILEDDLDGSQDSSNHSGGAANTSGSMPKKQLATDVDDPTTTNIFISNLSPKVDEPFLLDLSLSF